jgi:hypothetical protein
MRQAWRFLVASRSRWRFPRPLPHREIDTSIASAKAAVAIFAISEIDAC